MSEAHINYEQLMLERTVRCVRRVLRQTALHGLRGEHHFFIVFDTTHPGARVSDRLRKQYPQEMTIVLQHQFRNLRVSEEAFEVQLSFGGIPELLKIPFTAINGFVDPSVPFGLKLKSEPVAGLENSIAMLVPGLPRSETAGDRDDDVADLDEDDADEMPMETPVAWQRQSVPTIAPDDEPEATEEEEEAQPQANVVQLDAFRKKSS